MAPIRVGPPDVSPDAPSHVLGVREGNAVGSYEAQSGHHADGTADARRSTGIRPADRDPLSPAMPNLPPG
ncbi:conserved hypothetical protein [Frankia canadensis]|uniref:Uncharacterized protein n=1 Tax=Frankia canadensis TaxID=1836972 RepID=A0A2I2L2L5_9ACTN|nr:hypothetical protein [Frankia canadensis]SNQ52148.1 conserved hypothetical protein [Frankia canadensis]SOU59438.1 conserved hypothetical protein [Frankia canadensis]